MYVKFLLVAALGKLVFFLKFSNIFFFHYSLFFNNLKYNAKNWINMWNPQTFQVGKMLLLPKISTKSTLRVLRTIVQNKKPTCNHIIQYKSSVYIFRFYIVILLLRFF